ncbi:hypothetical protein ACO0SA_000802 [Hanseniaspora valbyensis]
MSSNNFKQVFSFNVEYSPQYTVKKFISERTKLQVVQIFSKASPMVEGYFAVGTEITNDSGIPHTLEHLVFTGSKKYPYKSILDKGANLSMSSTNAWTATDQTVYTLSTAGWLGFKNVLPFYLDCLFNPTLTEEAFTTEVYHIDPETLQDKGVVYSEMEAIENQSWFINDLAYKRLTHPQGSGYRSETGGLTENLRSLTIEEIREYHAKNYHSGNVCLIITGNVPTDELLEIVSKVDDELPSVDNFKRSFIETDTNKFLQPRFDEPLVEKTVQFPELDVSQGELGFYWITCDYTDSLGDLLLTILLEYLTDGSLSVLTKKFVEIDHPLANDVGYQTEDFIKVVANVYFSGVPTKRLQELKTDVMKTLREHKVDLVRIKQVLENYKLSYLSKLERSGADVLSSSVITNFLYDKDFTGETLINGYKTLVDFDNAAKLTSEEWTDLLQKWFVKNAPNVILSEPSAELYESSKLEKEERLNERKANFTEEYKKELAQKIKLADEINNTPVPESLLKQFNINDPSSAIDFIQTTSVPAYEGKLNGPAANTEYIQKLVDLQSKSKLPFSIHLEQFDSHFVEINLMLSSEVIKDKSLLPLYLLFCDSFTMPMKNSEGEIISYEKTVSALKDDTLSYSIQRNVVSRFYPETIKFKVKCKAENYAKGVNWIKRAIYDAVYDEQRINVLLDNFLSSIIESHRSGYNMLICHIKDLSFTEKSMEKATNILSNEEYLSQIKDDIEDGKFAKNILPQLERFRKYIIDGLREAHVLVLGDIQNIGVDNFYKVWEDNFAVENPLGKFPELPNDTDYFTPLRQNLGKKCFILTTPGSDSSFLAVKSNCPIDYYHPDYPILKLLLGYLQATEGPFWTSIRGLGLAYGAWAYNYVDIKDLQFIVYRAADLIKSYEAAEKIMQDLAEGTVEFDDNLLTGAIAIFLKGLAESNSSFLNTGYGKYVRTVGLMKDPEFTQNMIHELVKVEKSELQRCIKTYMLPLFKQATSSPFIACHPTKKDEFKEYMEKRGYEVEIRELQEDEEDDDDESCCSDSECESENDL